MRLKLEFDSNFPKSVHWSIRSWKSQERGGGHKKRFQYCIDSNGGEILHLRAIPGHSGEKPVDPSLQDKDNVLIPNGFFECICHVGSHLNVHSFIDSGSIAGGRKWIDVDTGVQNQQSCHADATGVDQARRQQVKQFPHTQVVARRRTKG